MSIGFGKFKFCVIMWQRLFSNYRIKNGSYFLFTASSFLIGKAAYSSVTFYNETPPPAETLKSEKLNIMPESLKDNNHIEIEKLADIIDSESVQIACTKSDEALKELLNTLTMCIVELSKEYQNCLMRQIEITYNCTQIGPVGEHWDELTEHRVRARDYKDELIKYEALICNIGQMVYNQALNSLYSGNPQAMELFSIEYDRLERLVRDEKKEILYWEKKLLSVNCDSII